VSDTDFLTDVKKLRGEGQRKAETARAEQLRQQELHRVKALERQDAEAVEMAAIQKRLGVTVSNPVLHKLRVVEDTLEQLKDRVRDTAREGGSRYVHEFDWMSDVDKLLELKTAFLSRKQVRKLSKYGRALVDSLRQLGLAVQFDCQPPGGRYDPEDGYEHSASAKLLLVW